VCTLLQSRKVLVSVVWATSSARHADWARHGPTAAAGRLHTITSRANLVLWHMHVPLPWHMHLCLRMIDRCRVTRPDQPTATRRFPSFASGPEIGKNCALRTPTIPLEVSSDSHTSLICLLPILHTTTTSRSPGDDTKQPSHTKHQTPPLPPPKKGNPSNNYFPDRSLARMHAFRRAIPGFFQYCFRASPVISSTTILLQLPASNLTIVQYYNTFTLMY
jgi:hypothetical protein